MSKYILIGILYILLVYPIGYIGYLYGINSVKEELEESNKIADSLEKQNQKQELEYTSKIKELESEIKITKINYSNSISEYNKQSSDKLLQSERRAQYYRQQAESCSTQSRNFAEYTARLDRQLTEGINLVTELTELIKLRDKQLNQVGEQLKLDRELINGK